MARESLDVQLAMLKQHLLDMGAMVSEAQRKAVQALADRDEDLARTVINDDQAINQAHRDIEEECLVLIASQQPVARDLRSISGISAIASDLERMGDHAKGIAVLTTKLSDQPLLKPLIDIPIMAETGRDMLREQLHAFVSCDPESARRQAKRDEEIDVLYDQVFRELLVIMMGDPRTITRATYLLWVAHNLERFADRTTNIGERVIFVASGDIVELSDSI